MGNEMPEGKKFNGEYARQMAKRSGEARRRNKAIKDIIQHILNSKVSVSESQTMLKQFDGLEDDEVSYKTAMTIQQLKKALKGDTQSYKVLLDYGGESIDTPAETKLPILNIEVTYNRDLEKEFEKYDE